MKISLELNFKTEANHGKVFDKFAAKCSENSKGRVKFFHKLQAEAQDIGYTPSAVFLHVAKAYQKLDKPNLAQHFLKLAGVNQ